MFGLIPREEAFFDLFRRAGHNVIEGSRLLKEMMENFHDPAGQAKRIKEVEHIGDEITHEIAKKLNQTFITPIDREDIHDLASALDDILDVAEEIADCFVIYKVSKPTPMAVRLADILYQASVAVASAVDLLGRRDGEMREYTLKVNTLENEADRLSRDARFNKEVAILRVDDAQGRIDGKLPGAAGYLQAALAKERWQRIFPSGAGAGASRDLVFKAGERFMVFIVQNGTVEMLRKSRGRSNQAPPAFFMNPAANPFGVDHVRLSELDNGYRLAWEDLLRGGDRDFNDVVIAVRTLTLRPKV